MSIANWYTWFAVIVDALTGLKKIDPTKFDEHAETLFFFIFGTGQFQNRPQKCFSKAKKQQFTKFQDVLEMEWFLSTLISILDHSAVATYDKGNK